MSNQIEIAKKIDGVVLSVIGKKGLAGFEKAHIVSTAIGELKKLLDDAYMKPIMELQGTALGFKTDKDKNGGYPMTDVRNVLIEAVLKGFQPTNNEFNIISGGMYPAKNGLKRKLDEIPGLKYTVVHTIKSWSVEKKNAGFETKIKWNNNGDSGEEIVPIITKIDAYSSTDAAIGKADRKAYAWLLGNITGEIVIDGEVEDADFSEVGKEQSSLPREEFTELHFEKAYDAGATIETIRNGYTTTAEIEQQYNDYESQRKANETA